MVEFQDLEEVTMKSTIFWGLTSCVSVEVYTELHDVISLKMAFLILPAV
jgi:hypothetical protein